MYTEIHVDISDFNQNTKQSSATCQIAEKQLVIKENDDDDDDARQCVITSSQGILRIL